MTKLLKIRFVKFDKALVAQQLTVAGCEYFDETEHVKLDGDFYLCKCLLSLTNSATDERVKINAIYFSNNAERDKYLNNVVKWISEEQFALGRKLEIGKECEASDNGEDWVVRSFAGKSAKQLGEPRYLAYWYDNLGYLIRYKYVRPLSSFVRPKIDGDVYTWEMEAKDER